MRRESFLSPQRENSVAIFFYRYDAAVDTRDAHVKNLLIHKDLKFVYYFAPISVEFCGDCRPFRLRLSKSKSFRQRNFGLGQLVSIFGSIVRECGSCEKGRRAVRARVFIVFSLSWETV
jgi:hypothetical protein